MIKLVDMGNSIIQTMMFMKENGRMIRQMEEEYIHMLMVLNIMVSGKMINNMALEKKAGLMGHYMKGNIMKERKMEKENLSLLMEVYMKGSFR